jgi:hypothetical protein
MIYIRRQWGGGWRGRLLLVGFAFHSKRRGGVYHNGKHWIIFPCFNFLGYHFDTKKWGEVYWVWPWKRQNGRAWFNTDCGGTFRTLLELDQFWEEHYAATTNYQP